MNSTRSLVLAATVFAAIAAAACGSDVTGGTGGGTTTTTTGSTSSSVTGPYDACTVASDCAWGEIDKEILATADCMCLFGCAYIPLSKATVDRRTQQYQALCTPGKDGSGQPCPIDDCAAPPAIDCIGGHCMAAQTP